MDRDSDTVQSPTQLEQKEEAIRLVPSNAGLLSVNVSQTSESDKPPLLTHSSNPAYDTPLRHHRRNPSTPRRVKESLNAHSEYITSEDDGTAQHRINQYIIKQEIGRGSFGAVHLALDQYGKEFAVKEFSKARLRKRAQSHILRRPREQRQPTQAAAKGGINSPLHRREPSQIADGNGEPPSSIDLIKEEIAIMKKLDHPNLVSLLEVLDDPSEDSLYMVMELCKKGVAMKVGLQEKADPYPEDVCRHWFRDLMLAIEYLHAQGIVHRDIKPDNCLITDGDVMKVTDFGVSEMFEKDSEMLTAKSAGSPAFMPPELCLTKHGDVSGKAADIWSMGVTLYCLRYGRIPFERTGIFELYEAIRVEDLTMEGESDRDFQDLMFKLLEKDPAKRIKMPELRAHPWVTNRGAEPLLSEAENTADLVEPPTAAEMDHAITSKMTNLLTVVKAVNKFKSLLNHNRPPIISSILGEDEKAHFSYPPLELRRDMPPPPHLDHKSHSQDNFDRRPLEGASATEGTYRQINLSKQGAGQLDARNAYLNIGPDAPGPSRRRPKDDAAPPPIPSELSTESDHGLSRSSTNLETPSQNPDKFPPFPSTSHVRAQSADDSGHRGHAHDPLQDHLYLFVGPSTFADTAANMARDRRLSFVPEEDDVPIVSESPGAADIEIYETAYRDEIERIRHRAAVENSEPTVYLTRRVDAKLLALSRRAGHWYAMGEEGMDKLQYATNFRERKAKVTDVSRALKAAAKEEYLKRKEERKSQSEQWKPEGSKPTPPPPPPRSEKAKVEDEHLALPTSAEADEPPRPSLGPSFLRSPLAGKSFERGKQATSSFLGLVGAMKDKAKSSRAGDGGS